MTRRIIWVSTITFLLLSIPAIAQQSSAAELLSVVQGRVWDQIGNPLEGANVTVNVYDSGMTLQDTKYDDATDVDGFYSVSFVAFNGDHVPDVGDTIEVVAKYLSEPDAPNSTVVATAGPIYSINVTVSSVVIPEFGLGQGIGLPVAILGILAVFAIVKRKKASE